MKYDKDTSDQLVKLYEEGNSAAEIAELLEMPERSIIAKLSSLGIYKKKQYLSKTGQPPTKKEVYIERIAVALQANIELLESLEKVNKAVLVMLDKALQAK